MKLIDIIEILSDHYKIKIGLDGDYVGTFDKGDVRYYLLQMKVTAIYPMKNGENSTRLYIAVDLVTD